MQKICKNIDDVLKHLYELSVNKNERKLCFRGQAYFNWPIIPNIYRQVENFERYQSVFYEDILLGLKPREKVSKLIYTDFEIEWLSLCQHFGVPTRLVDWTTDILTALYFACSTEIEKDAALFICDSNDFKTFKTFEGTIMNTQELVFLDTYITNPRIRVQHGCFMVWGHENGENGFYDLEEYVKDKSIFLEKICIPAENKKEILKELKENYGIDYLSIYLVNQKIEKKKYEWIKIRGKVSKLLTLYFTNCERLEESQVNQIEKIFKMKDIFGNTKNLRSSEIFKNMLINRIKTDDELKTIIKYMAEIYDDKKKNL